MRGDGVERVPRGGAGGLYRRRLGDLEAGAGLHAADAPHGLVCGSERGLYPRGRGGGRGKEQAAGGLRVEQEFRSQWVHVRAYRHAGITTVCRRGQIVAVAFLSTGQQVRGGVVVGAGQ